MRGLLYKEWLLGRKTFCALAALSFVFCVLGILIFLSMICGNLQNWPEEEAQSVQLLGNVFLYVPYLIMLVGVDGCNQSIFTDYDSGFMTYTYTLPISAKKAAGARYLMAGIVLGVGFLYGIFNAAIICGLSEFVFGTEILKNLFCILVGVVVLVSIILPLSLQLKSRRMINTICGVSFIILYAGSGVMVFHFGKIYGEALVAKTVEIFERVRDVFFVASPLILVLCIGISFCCSVKILKRREKTC